MEQFRLHIRLVKKQSVKITIRSKQWSTFAHIDNMSNGERPLLLLMFMLSFVVII